MKMAKNQLNLKKEIKEMFKKGKYEKLYSVCIYIQNDVAGTSTWFIYDDIYYVKNYLRILRDHYKSLSDCKEIDKYTYEYTAVDGSRIKEHIEVKGWTKRAA